MSILTGAVLLTLAPGDDEAAQERRVALAVTLTFLVGGLAMAMGVLRLGFIECLLSRATNRGFVTGVALVIMIEQLPKFFGLTDLFEPDATPIAKFVFVCEHLYETEPIAVSMGTGVLAFLFAFNAVKARLQRFLAVRLFPSIMVAVIVTILVTWGLRLDERGLAILGDVPAGFVAPRAPTVCAWPRGAEDRDQGKEARGAGKGCCHPAGRALSRGGSVSRFKKHSMFPLRARFAARQSNLMRRPLMRARFCSRPLSDLFFFISLRAPPYARCCRRR